ncbi:hypothetical protein CPB83DRAFT_899571 [Crepidotus variabilis]|uniref:Uncharacterized protein n=1 Tax=Crepidotus variabilis TaxID=179855 RepID=A0A9P6JIR4_9AGAR|nr:hypothetical protein CPB83DRAFT_899571 [Crepidotus variabilis]
MFGTLSLALLSNFNNLDSSTSTVAMLRNKNLDGRHKKLAGGAMIAESRINMKDRRLDKAEMWSISGIDVSGLSMAQKLRNNSSGGRQRYRDAEDLKPCRGRHVEAQSSEGSYLTLSFRPSPRDHTHTKTSKSSGHVMFSSTVAIAHDSSYFLSAIFHLKLSFTISPPLHYHKNLMVLRSLAPSAARYPKKDEKRTRRLQIASTT